MTVPMTPYDEFKDDLPALARGTLDPDRTRALLEAAKQDTQLKRAIEQERALEHWLEAYEVPEPSADLPARFWKRFHQVRVQSGGRLLRLIGPAAAAILVAAGLWLFIQGDDTPPPADTPVVAEVEDDAVFFEYLADPDAGADQSDQPTPQPTEEELALLKLLSDPAFAELDKVPHPDDLLLVQDHELVTELAAREAGGE